MFTSPFVASERRELVTQMYFACDNNEHCGNFGFSKQRDRLTVAPTALKDCERDGLAATFDLVLAAA